MFMGFMNVAELPAAKDGVQKQAKWRVTGLQRSTSLFAIHRRVPMVAGSTCRFAYRCIKPVRGQPRSEGLRFIEDFHHPEFAPIREPTCLQCCSFWSSL